MKTNKDNIFKVLEEAKAKLFNSPDFYTKEDYQEMGDKEYLYSILSEIQTNIQNNGKT